MSNGKGIILTGIITDIFPAEVYGNFEKRVLWLKQPDSEKYPEHWQIEFHQGNANQLDNFKVGQSVEITVDIKGRGWEKGGKKSIFVTLKATDIVKQGESKPTPSNRQKTGRADRYQQDSTAYNDGEPQY